MRINPSLILIAIATLASAPLTADAASRLENISTRGQVLTGDGVLIAGFIIEGTEDKTVLIRARGPSLAEFGVSGPLNDPLVTLNA